MATDITPELLNRIKKQFGREYDNNSVVKSILKKVENGSATYDDANKYAQTIGDMLSKALQNNLSSDVLPDGRMYYNIANTIFNDVLGNNYKLAADVSASAQQVINEKTGIGLKAIAPEVNQDKIDGIVNRVSSEEFFDNVKWIIGEPITNFTQSAVDDTVKKNADFQYGAGLKPKIVRKLGGKCCDWCAKLVGTYSYPDIPQDVYRRHENCRCTVEFLQGNKRTDVHTKKSYVEEHREEVEERIKKITGNAEFVPAKNIKEAEQFLSQYVDKNQFGALGVSYAGLKIDSANAINKVISDFYKEFNFDKFGGIKAPTPNSKEGRLIADAIAGYSQIRNSIYLNRETFKTLKAAEEAFEKEKQIAFEFLNQPEKFNIDKLSEKVRKILEFGKTSGRLTYPKTLEESLHHELGHMVEAKIKRLGLTDEVESGMMNYGPKISGYACYNVGEYIAESFTAYWNGDLDILDPKIVSVFNLLRKKK